MVLRALKSVAAALPVIAATYPTAGFAAETGAVPEPLIGITTDNPRITYLVSPEGPTFILKKDKPIPTEIDVTMIVATAQVPQKAMCRDIPHELAEATVKKIKAGLAAALKPGDNSAVDLPAIVKNACPQPTEPKP
jgi:hypothetical protein